MDFSHSSERQMLADSLARTLLRHYPIETRHRICASAAGWSATQWAAFAELGIVGALFGEVAGGFGGSGFDIAAVFEQLGKALVVEPFLSTLMAGCVLEKTRECDDLLGQIIAGQKMLTLAHQEPQSRYDLHDVQTRATADGEGWKLSGSKAVVPQLETADIILVSARLHGGLDDGSGLGLFLIERGAAGLNIRGYPMIDGGRGGELVLAGAVARRVGSATDGFALIEQATAAGIVALCWEAVGVMDTLKSATLDYLRIRRQFGAPIGKFQALQHRMATVALEIEQARSAAINAAAALETGRWQRERAVSAAKFTIGRVGTLVAEESIQMHGGIGMTWELPVSHYAKRLTMIGHQLGDEDHHLARFIALGNAAPAQ
jgi:alkylation response protein AidB-like acyl-CoA dehydrogenase